MAQSCVEPDTTKKRLSQTCSELTRLRDELKAEVDPAVILGGQKVIFDSVLVAMDVCQSQLSRMAEYVRSAQPKE